MRHLYYCCALLACIFSYARDAYSDFNVHHNKTSFVEPKPKPEFGSKPAYPKYAGVTFITDDDANKFKFDAADVRTQCMALGFAYLTDNCEAGTAKALCSSVVNLPGAEKYTSGCCNRKYYSYDDNNQCGNNNTIETCTTASGKNYYHCGCNRSLYPFSGDSDCPHGNVVNMVNSCTTNDENNVSTTYYATCCPASYQEVCNGNHQVGNGTACYRKDGESLVAKYESCSCSSNYDTPCPGRMIDPGDYCKLGENTILTKDTNCEKPCERSTETNVDAEFYNQVWHCLYREDGATIKAPEAESGLCRIDAAAPSTETEYFDSCENQGYRQLEADCNNKDIILRCPQDVSKVWCLDSKYCTGYNVKTDDAYEKKARVVQCPRSDKGVRYAYLASDCNTCWTEEGKYDAAKCAWNTDSNGLSNGDRDKSVNGDGNYCCRLGYVMNDNGICVKNTCDRTRFPYDHEPEKDIGTIEVCYEGNPAVLDGYEPYYGYSSCNDDVSRGGFWIADSNNPRKCICNRKIPGRELPYDNTMYAEPAPNFASGQNGKGYDCTDNEGSYYGYASCNRGYTYAGGDDFAGGLCKDVDCVGYTVSYPYLWQAYNLSAIMADMASRVPLLSSVSGNSVEHCIAKYKHYEDELGNKLGDDSVGDLVKEGCNYGDEQECNECWSIANLAKEKKNGLYTAHDKFRLQINTCFKFSPNRKFFALTQCPKDAEDSDYNYLEFKSGRGCYKYCKLSNLQKCYLGNVVLDDREGYENTKLGVVDYLDSKSIRIEAYKGYRSDLNWHGAMQYAEQYYVGSRDDNVSDEIKEKYKTDERFGIGKWRMAPFAVDAWNIFVVNSSLSASGSGGVGASSVMWLPVSYECQRDANGVITDVYSCCQERKKDEENGTLDLSKSPYCAKDLYGSQQRIVSSSGTDRKIILTLTLQR